MLEQNIVEYSSTPSAERFERLPHSSTSGYITRVTQNPLGNIK